MSIKTNLLEEYVNFVVTTNKQSKHFKTYKLLMVIILALFLFFVLFEYLNE